MISRFILIENSWSDYVLLSFMCDSSSFTVDLGTSYVLHSEATYRFLIHAPAYLLSGTAICSRMQSLIHFKGRVI